MGGGSLRAGKKSLRCAPGVHAPTLHAHYHRPMEFLIFFLGLTGFFTLFILFHTLHPDFRGHGMTWGWAFGLGLAVIVGQCSVLIYRTF